MHNRKFIVSAVMVGLLSVAGLSLAQAPPQGQGPGRGPGAGQGQGGQRFDPEQMRQRMMERVKEEMGVGDKEWGAIQPALEEVMNLNREVGGGGMFGRRFRGGPGAGGPGGGPGGGGPAGGGPAGGGPAGGGAGGGGADQGPPQTAVGKATQDLQTTLQNKDATADEIKAKVAALREAREKAKKELTTSKEALREMLTPRQEAQLILMGILD